MSLQEFTFSDLTKWSVIKILRTNLTEEIPLNFVMHAYIKKFWAGTEGPERRGPERRKPNIEL